MAQELKEGALLDNEKYKIIKVLGQGGFGITYLALDLGLDKFRAIKEFFPKEYCERDETTSHVTLGTSSNADFIEQLKRKFIKEARNIANLDQHQGIIKIHTVFEENNTAYYVMDYIEGESLSTLVKRDGPLPEARAVKYIKQAGEALEYVHSHKVVHLDVKPANIMIRRKDDCPILIDFGLAKQYDKEGFQTSTTPTGVSHGYAPFEQYKAGGVKEFSPQTDVYSLAATLYFAVSGQVPPHATDLFENELSFLYGFPLNLMDPIIKAMSTRRQDRPETMAKFIASLDKAENEKSVEATVIKPSDDTLIKPETPTPKKKNIEPEPIPEEKSSQPVQSKKINVWLIGGVALAAAALTCLIVLWAIGVFSGGAEETSLPVAAEPVEVELQSVEGIELNNQLGNYTYTGLVNENGLPESDGVAHWKEGQALSYDGQWIDGNMDGEGTYTLRNGDTFVGTFHENKYAKGRYTNKATGEYFEGTFKNEQPYQGHYYNKEGVEIFP